MCIACLSSDERNLAVELIDQIILKRETLPYEQDLLTAIYEAWNEAKSKGLKTALEFIEATQAAFTQDDLRVVLQILEGELGGEWAAELAPELKSLFERAYLNGKAVALASELTEVSFELVDEFAVDWLASHDTYWIGNYYSRHLSDGIATTIGEGIEEGLGRAEIGDTLRGFFEDYPGISQKPESYWRGLAANGANRGRNFGAIRGYQDAEFDYLKFQAVRDEKTSSLCLEMDGRIIPVSKAASQRDRLLYATDPEEVKNITPWVSVEDIKGKPTSDIIDMGVIVPPLHFHCYRAGTEVYSSKGWVEFPELTTDDELLSLNPTTFDLEWLKPKKIISQHHKGTMVEITMRNFHMCVTPDHQMFYKKRWDERNGRDKWQFIEAINLPPDAKIYRSSRWKGQRRDSVNINGLVLPTEDFCAFLALYLTEGSYKKDRGYDINIAQYKTESKAQMLEVLQRLPVTVGETQGGIRVCTKELHSYVQQFGKCDEKFIPDVIKSLPAEQIKVFLKYFRLGDGGKVPGKENWKGYKLDGNYVYRTSSKRMADDLGELILKIGCVPSYHLIRQKGNRVKFHNGTYTIKTDCWCVFQLRNQQSSLQNYSKRVKLIQYEGLVHCAELPRNHTLYVRSKGKCAWSGNCRSTLVVHEG